MKKLVLLTACALALIPLKGYAAAAPEVKVGVVNVKTCMEKSKKGQQEKAQLEAMKKQMTETLEKSDKELQELAKKLEDKDYLDSLSPTAESELKGRFENLSQEFVRYQNQYYQLLQQANYRVMQMLHEAISKASEEVRGTKNLVCILNRDSGFAFASTLDVTDEVIKGMDKQFELDGSAPKAAKNS